MTDSKTYGETGMIEIYDPATGELREVEPLDPVTAEPRAVAPTSRKTQSQRDSRRQRYLKRK